MAELVLKPVYDAEDVAGQAFDLEAAEGLLQGDAVLEHPEEAVDERTVAEGHDLVVLGLEVVAALLHIGDGAGAQVGEVAESARQALPEAEFRVEQGYQGEHRGDVAYRLPALLEHHVYVGGNEAQEDHHKQHDGYEDADVYKILDGSDEVFHCLFIFGVDKYNKFRYLHEICYFRG